MSLIHHVKRVSAVSIFALATSTAFADVTVSTKYGEVTVKDNATQIVTLAESALDVMSAIDVEVAGSVATRGSETVSRYLEDKQAGIQIVGTARETNIEAVIGLRPDVILASSSLPKAQYDVLSKIAPTIVPDTTSTTPGSWKTDARLYGKAISQSEAIEQALKAVDDRAANIKEKVDASIPKDQRTAFIARWMPQGAIVMSKDLFVGSLLNQVGFKADDADLLKPGRPHSSPLSLENLSAIDGDWLFLATLNDDGKEALDAAKKSPAFARLDVVKSNHTATVDGQVWSSTSGPLAAHVILDDIEALLEANTQ